MNRKLGNLLAIALAIGVPGTASAWEWGTTPGGIVDVYGTPKTSVHFGGSPGGAIDDLVIYADGGGFRSTFRVYDWVGVLAEYQNLHANQIVLGSSSGSAGGTVEEFRVGPGYLHSSGSGFFVEYENRHSSGYTEDGFGARGRLASRPVTDLQGFAELGFASLESSDSSDPKVKNLHLALGGAYTITGDWALFAEYRRTRGTNDSDDLIVTQEDFRLGIRASLDY